MWRKYRGHSNVLKPTRDSILNEFSTKWLSVSNKNMKHLHLLNACLATDPCPLPILQSLGQDWTHCLQQLANVLSKKASFAGLECSIHFQTFYIIWLTTHPLKISLEHLWSSLNFNIFKHRWHQTALTTVRWCKWLECIYHSQPILSFVEG